VPPSTKILATPLIVSAVRWTSCFFRFTAKRDN